MRYTDDELAAILDKELRQALGAPGTEISLLRLRNLQYYKGEATGELGPPSIPDRSSIVATDVADTVEWMLPSLVRVFAASQDAVECEPKRPEFAPQAKLVSEYLRHIFWKRNRGFDVLYQWFKDALIQKVGFVKIYWDKIEQDVEETYRSLLPEQVAEILKDSDVSPVEQAEYQILVEGQPLTVYDLKVKRVQRTGRVRIDPVPPEEMRVHPRSRYGNEPTFVAHVFYRTKQDLEADGYDLSNVGTNDGWSLEEIERVETQTPWFFDQSDGDLQRYRCEECYIRLDQDKDGIPEWRRVFKIGPKILENEKVEEHPFAWFCPVPLPHTFFGNCPADFAIEPQRLNTSLLRALLDNVYLSVNKRVGVLEGQVNLDDLLNSRPGGVVRMKSANSLLPLEQSGLDPGAWQMVEWGSQWREQRTGFTRQSNGLNPDALADSQVGSVGVMNMAERADQRIELISRVAAESVRTMYEKMLRLMSRYQDVPDQVELFGQWISVDPREWNDAYHIYVNVGLGTGNKDKRAQVLQQVMQIQAQMVAQGAMDAKPVILAARGFAESAGLANPEQYFPDPLPPDPNKKSPEQMKVEADIQREQARAQADIQKFQAQSQADAQSKQLEIQGEIEKARITTESNERIEAAKITSRQQELLLNLAAGVMAAHRSGAVTNLTNGTQLDQTTQSPGFELGDLNAVVSQIQGLAQQIANPNPTQGLA
ncbi:hypothetical protein IP84_17005 [beta proteobacterium AAP99]|nr:hypothetical protein IP84_17005 [beta proteobacterium AAP99]